MSVKALAWAFDQRVGAPGLKVLLLALADFADDENGITWRRRQVLAERVEVSERTISRYIQQLIDLGLISVEQRRLENGANSTNCYRLNLEHQLPLIPPGQIGSRPSTARQHAVSTPGTHSVSTPGTTAVSTPGTHSVSTIESSSESSVESSSESIGGGASAPAPAARRKKTETTLKQFFANCRAAGEEPIPPTDPIFDYARKVGIPEEWLALCWRVFREKYLDRPKRYSDWRAAFRNCVRENWFGIWSFDAANQCVITGKGRQYELAHRKAA